MSGASPAERRLVVVLGMHRSGTSAVARGLEVLGVDLGDRLEPPDQDVNAKGYFEDVDLVALNDELLAGIGRDWASLAPTTPADVADLQRRGLAERAAKLLRGKLRGDRPFGFKDPRTAKLLGFWWPILVAEGYDVRFVLAVRNPLSVVRSLTRRDRFEPELGYELWLDHVVACLGFLGDKPAVVVDYDRLLADPRRELTRVAAVVGGEVDRAALDVYVGEFLAGELRHFVATSADVAADPAARPAVREAAQLVERMAMDACPLAASEVRSAVAAWAADRDQVGPIWRAFDRRRREAAGIDDRLEAAEAAAKAAVEEAAAAATSLAAATRRCRDLETVNDAIRASLAWRATAPFRATIDVLREFARAVRAAPEAIRIGGGPWRTFVTALRVLAREGVRGLRARVRHAELAAPAATATAVRVQTILVEPLLARQLAVASGPAGVTALHLHVESPSALASAAGTLAACSGMPCVVTVAGDGEADVDACRRALAGWNLVAVRGAGAGGALAAFVEHALPRFAGVDFVGHLRVADDDQASLAMLLGAHGAGVAPFLARLSKGAPTVFADRLDVCSPSIDEADLLDAMHRVGEGGFDAAGSAWSGGRVVAGFWARSDAIGAISRFATAQRAACDALPRPDAALEAALQAAFARLVASPQRRALRLFDGDAGSDHRHFEPQLDFSGRLVGNDVLALSYYLPQFHPIPENDAWHGKGFTEWTKVRAASPLFVGHHQQRVPADAVGYYLLDSVATLRRQAEDMRRAGVHGQVFYHYWFGGRLILEQPARMLLASPDVPMRFCFCWANENWTRRWDGNEREILLAQAYSRDDAVAFIRYLIPFFKDPRHVKVDGRPLLFVYRPSSLPDAREYVAAWRAECAAAGIAPPFVVAVLTRGAVDPRDYGMDAATERVLHDWTDGAVRERKNELAAFAPIAGRVIDYAEVAAHYEAKPLDAPFETYRSIVPSWDNTPRYGREACVVHGSTPRRFQAWFERLVQQAREGLPAGRRFVLVNAWNEWAEGAHLEADDRHGHAYLNSLGRALVGEPFPSNSAASPALEGLRVRVVLAPAVVDRMARDERFARAFERALGRSRLLRVCKASLAASDPARRLAAALPVEGGDADLVLEVRRPCLFGPDVLLALVERAAREPGIAAVANAYEPVRLADDVDPDGRVADDALATASLVVRPMRAAGRGPTPVRMATAARCFPLAATRLAAGASPTVTTIVRFHRRGDLALLRNALGCLAAMTGCRVVPMLALQDLDDSQERAVRALVDEHGWADGVEPEIHVFRSADGRGDLRSIMLNESLRRAKTRFVGFLDHDDLLFPDAYSWLAGRLVATGKAIAFGRVFQATYDRARDLIIDRARVYESGSSHADFVDNNFAPIHSFLLDVSRLDVGKVRHFDDQRYMEDYYLMLQLVTRDNADWDGLAMNRYVGDYLHVVGGGQTLAITDPATRMRMLGDPLYQRCERRINELRARLR